MNPVLHWIGGFPKLQQAAIVDAIESASLAKVNHALPLIEELDTAQRGPVFQVELVSTFNLEPVRPVLQLALNCLPSRTALLLAPLNAIEAYLARSADLHSLGSLDARLIIWRVEEVFPEALYPFSNKVVEKPGLLLDQVLERIERVISLHRRHATGVPLFISTFALPIYVSNSLSAAQDRIGLFGSVAAINQKIYELAARESGVHVLDLNVWAAWEGKGHADLALDLLARQPLSAKGQLSFALFIARCLRPLIVPQRKALALDLDNTLWGGAVGEDGIEGLILGHEFPGNVHLRIQRELLELRHRGIALVLLSKNNEAEARQAFEALPDMLVKWSDFVVHKVDWNPKPDNLRAAARELGLGVDSFVFLDDSDYERELMRQMLPEVLILNESADPLRTLRSLCETDAFDSLSVSEEDRGRDRDYRARAARNVSAHEDDLEAFLISLQMEATIERADQSNLDRLVTMLNKTNQFNLTTRRHSRAEVQKILQLPGSIALALRLRDKFGDQGIVALLLAIPAAEDRTLFVDSFLVSCRALGRGVENTLWTALVNRAHRQGVQKLEAEYLATAKNDMVADLYPKLGLKRIAQNGSATSYLLQPVERRPVSPWIALVGENDDT